MRVSKNQRSLLLEKFEAFLSSERRVSQKTLRNYRSDLNNFLSWCRHYFSSENSILLLTASIVESYKKSQMENRVPVATINRRLSTLRNFAEFLMFEGLLEKNPLEAIPNIKRLTEDIGRDEPVTGPVLKSPPPPPRMPKELTTPYKVKGDDNLFLHRVKITIAAISGFGSVFVLLFIAKSIFGDALIFGPQARSLNQKPIEEIPLLAATVSFGDLLAQTPAVLGVSTQKVSVLSQSTAQGTATLSAGSREIALYSPNLATNSRITVIPENSIEGTLLVSRDGSQDYFTVAVDRLSASDIPFSWEIVN